MTKKELAHRYTLFVFSVLVNAFSIAVITKALLGTSPISSVPYVLSIATPLTMGQYTIIMNLMFIVLEMLLMKRKEVVEKRYELMSQVPITLLFGFFIDVSMTMLGWLVPANYLLQIVTLVVGCFILGVGISLEVKADVAMVTGEYLVRILTRYIPIEFGYVKVLFDATLVIIACTLSLIFIGPIEGVREGTIVAALIVGPISHFVMPAWKIFNKWIYVDKQENEPATQDLAKQHVVITIARECGSGGRLLGEMLAKRLGIKYYDKKLIRMAAEETQMPEEFVSENEQKMPTGLLYNLVMRDYQAPIHKSMNRNDALFVAQSRIIRRIASEQTCIIVGRLSDFVLKDYPPERIIRVFCFTNPADAQRRCTDEYGVDSGKVKALISQTNTTRAAHYRNYTGQEWGDPRNYDLSINTGAIGLDAASDLIAQLYAHKSSAINVK